MSRAVVLAARPEGEPTESDFEVVEAPTPSPGEGEVLVRNVFVSVDPYMRGRMTGVDTYVKGFAVGDQIIGDAVGRVVASNDPGLAEGDWVESMLGWRDEGIVSAKRLRKLDPRLAPPSTALGVLGMPGMTAWYGLLEVGRPQEGETVYVSGAAGAVGSVAGQIAKLKGCRVLGSAGSPEKVEWLRELGFDEAFDYHDEGWREHLREGIDVYFDNVSGGQLEGALSALRPFGRVVACGAVSRYNDTKPSPGPRNLGYVVTKRLRVEGFIVIDHMDRFRDFLKEVGSWVRDGKIRYRETIVDGGVEGTPRAFIGLLRGENIGKMLVRVGPDD